MFETIIRYLKSLRFTKSLAMGNILVIIRAKKWKTVKGYPAIVGAIPRALQ